MAETNLSRRAKEIERAQTERRSSSYRWPASSQPLHILVVDDNEDVAESLAVLLRIDGHEVKTAYEGPSAIRIAIEWRPQVIIQDIRMPGMSGYRVAQTLRQWSGTKETVLIAVTGSEDRMQSQDAGFDYHLVKPVDLREFRRILNQLALEMTHKASAA